MLEGLRRQGSSVVIYLLFGLLIVIFVIQGPGTPGGDRGCGSASSDHTALTINGEKVRARPDFLAVSSFVRDDRRDMNQAKAIAMDLLVRRELLAQEAERRDLRVEKEMVDREIMRGYYFFGGLRYPARGQFFEKVDDEYIFQHKKGFLPFVHGALNLASVSGFIELQQRELLAALMAESLREQVVVSRDEALAEFLHEGNTVTYDVVAFSPMVYRNALLPTEEDVAKWAAAHGTEIEAKYKAEASLYKAVKDQIRVREIFVAKAEAKSAGAAPAAEASDPGKVKLELARADIAAGKRKFEDVARELSAEAAARALAGDQGWRTKEFPGFSEPAINAAVKTLEVGKVSDVIVTSRGFHLLLVQDSRKGDLTLEQVKNEIALELAKDAWAKEAARQAAVAAFESAQRGVVKNLADLYKDPSAPAPDAAPGAAPGVAPPPVPVEPASPKTGAIEWESENVPAAWIEEPATAEAAGSAAPAAAAPAAGAAPAAAAPAAGAAPAPAAAVDLMKLPAQPLPPMATVAAPISRRIANRQRDERLPELGTSKPAIKALFDQLAPGELAKTIYEADGDYALVQLIERNSPKMEDFDKDADLRMRTLRARRAQEMLESWLKQGCEAAVKAKKLKPNAAFTSNVDEKTGKVLPSYYTPCFTFR